MQRPLALGGLDDRNLNRAIRLMALILLIGVPLIAALYWMDRHVDPVPSLADRNVSAAEAAVRNDPNDLAARNHLAAAYVSAKRFDDGIAQFGQILQTDATNRAARLGRGLAYMATERYGEAADDFQALIDGAAAGEFAATDPQLQQAYYELGVARRAQGRPADAIEPLRSALRIDGGDADALYQFGMASIETGDAASGVQALARAVAFVPSGWCEPYAGLEQGYTALGDQAGVAYAQGMVSFCAGRLGEAATRLQTVTTGPRAVDALLGLALVAAQRGDAAAAAGYYQDVLARDPSNTSALIGLGQLGGSGAHPAQPVPSAGGSN